jgi:hypothetical protein
VARQLPLAAYLLSSRGNAKDELTIGEILSPCEEIYAATLGEDEDRERAGDAPRRRLVRGLDALAEARPEPIPVEGVRAGEE